VKKSVFFISILILLIGIAGSQENIKGIQFNSVNTSEPDSVKTLKSLKKESGLYMMTYYGDYSDILDRTDDIIINRGLQSVRRKKAGDIKCSMFSALGNPDLPLYGRNFDNPDCGVLITKYNPPEGYASIGFSRINDFGFEKDANLLSLPIKEKQMLLNAPFFTPDGMNECGVAAALAALRSVRVDNNNGNKSIFVTRLVREILDHAKDLDEAISIVKSNNVYDNDINTLSHHLLIADPSGRSVIMEYYNGEWKTMDNKEPWQVITNSPLYDRSIESRKSNCWRYKKAYEKLEQLNGITTREESMNILKSVSGSGTQWSTICDMKKKEIYISLYRNYDSIQKVKIKE